MDMGITVVDMVYINDKGEDKMITKNYIKMCKKNEDLQKLCKYRMGDWFLFPEGLGVLNGNIDGKLKFPWLPTQEQLQEMLWQGLDEYEYWVRKLYDYILDIPLGDEMSMNELWLAFVMKEKYDKIWNGKDWEKWKV